MELIVAVYDDWGIGKDGTQPVALAADRKFFRQTTRGATVIAGRKTVADFPGQKPLPGRENYVLSRQDLTLPGFGICHDLESVRQVAEKAERAFIIGGGRVYASMLPDCKRAYVTKVHCTPPSDTFFPNLDADPAWKLTQILQSGEENGIRYEMCLYERK